MKTLPGWIDVLLIPAINLALAFFVAGLVVVAIGEDPLKAVNVMLYGAFGSAYGLGFTLFYATTFVFTGLAVAIAFHAALFNIGGEGQANLGCLGAALACLWIPWPHWSLAIIGASIGAAIFGAAWAAIPAYLQAKRGSHIVITTIMFNYIASALIVYLLVEVLRARSGLEIETAKFPEGAHLPYLHEMAAWFGLKIPRTPANFSIVLAVLASVFTWALIWRTRLGYEMRALGHSEPGAIYAGISPFKITMIAMLLSGAMAGLMAINAVQGDLQRLKLDVVQGAGFVGIAVALMGRSHPIGVVLAALLFGILYQGGAELAFEMPGIRRDLIVVIQGLVILFTGALEGLSRMPLERVYFAWKRRQDARART